MTDGDRAPQKGNLSRCDSAWLVASGVFDWLLIVATAVGGQFLGNITPNKRAFQLENPDISFPHIADETVSPRNLVIATVVVPVAAIIVVSLVFVPGLSTPSGIKRSLVWRRKLWELYASLLSFALGMATQWFIINGLKNICGKPRPDLLARCQPDTQNVAYYVVGGIANSTSNGQLVDPAICTNTDTSVLNDGFRSYPSGHSSSAAAGLGYLALFLAFKLGVVFPLACSPASRDAAVLSALSFPSRSATSLSQKNAYELHSVPQLVASHTGIPSSAGAEVAHEPRSKSFANFDRMPLPARRAGAAPPLYLLVIVLAPLFGSVFIAASRWYNYRHHGFDIIFGYSIGAVTALVAFRMYQLPLSSGAGWAWGPRSPEKAFWAGVGSTTWAEAWEPVTLRTSDVESAYGFEPHRSATPETLLSRRTAASARPLPRDSAE
ncbi:hypothetical protein SEPCBS119000_006461 [Sporothrix epigloea]|uniref:Phosphatidic acid phosphatase type 2/haloperoxidase domain-containing protein n=1 Tax=Sporothrix epigloea TaxID=1892477 RepID=A0ABP0E344_9PEZI